MQNFDQGFMLGICENGGNFDSTILIFPLRHCRIQVKYDCLDDNIRVTKDRLCDGMCY